MADKLQIEERNITIKGLAGDLPTFTAQPKDGRKYPGLILVHEIFGLNDHIRNVAKRFAAEGMTVYAPDLFAHHPEIPTDKDDLNAMRNVWSKIPDSQLIGDLQKVMDEMKSSAYVQADKIGTVGFCMGGAIAYIFACSTPEVAWVADFYGRIYYPELTAAKPKHPIDYTASLPCPLLGLFAGIDDLITHEHIMMLKKALYDHKKEAEVVIFDDAHHAFFNDEREKTYHAEAAEEAWGLTIDLAERIAKAPAK